MRVSIVGTGNVGYHLTAMLRNIKSVHLVNILGTTLAKAKTIRGQQQTIHVDSVGQLLAVDYLIIAVSDASIASVSKALAANDKLEDTIICHTSGSTSSAVLATHRLYGVLYPLQTFTKGQRMGYRNIPMCICANSDQATSDLASLAALISDDVRPISDSQRAAIHLSAVVANNFINHIIHLAQQRLQHLGIDADILTPLIEQTVKKAANIGALSAQTGPAKRADQAVLSQQMAALHKEEHILSIYKAVTDSILHTYNHKS